MGPHIFLFKFVLTKFKANKIYCLLLNQYTIIYRGIQRNCPQRRTNLQKRGPVRLQNFKIQKNKAHKKGVVPQKFINIKHYDNENDGLQGRHGVSEPGEDQYYRMGLIIICPPPPVEIGLRYPKIQGRTNPSLPSLPRRPCPEQEAYFF